MATRGTAADVARCGKVEAGEACFVLSDGGIGVVAGLAADPNEVLLQVTDSAGQNQPHACVPRVERVHVATTEAVFFQWESTVGAVRLEAKRGE